MLRVVFVRTYAWIWRLYLLLGVALAGSYALVDGPSARVAIYETASVLGLAAVGLRARRSGPYAPAWRALAVGVAVYALADAAWVTGELSRLDTRPVSSVLYLAAYPPFLIALWWLSSPQDGSSETGLRRAVDGAMVFMGTLPLLWLFVIEGALEKRSLPRAEAILAGVYPVLDLLLLSVLLGLLFTGGSWTGSRRLLTVGFACVLVGDVFWRELLWRNAWGFGAWVDVLFLAGYIFWGAAALHPSSTRPDPAAGDRQVASRWLRRIVLLGLAGLAPAVALALSRASISKPNEAAVFAISFAFVPLLSLARLADIMRAHGRAAASAAEARDRLDAIIRASPVPVCVVDRETGAVLLWNPAAEAVSGYTAAEVLGKPPPLDPPPDDARRVADLYGQALAGTSLDRVEVILSNKGGEELDFRISTAPLPEPSRALVAVFEDVTLEKRQAARIAYLAEHDPLTDLPNRRVLDLELELALARRAAGSTATLVLIDVDNFKFVNDGGGHTVGDQLLKDIADILRSETRSQDFLARLAGDEFALLLDCPGYCARKIVNRMIEAASAHRLLTAHGIFDATISAGSYELAPEDTPDEAVRHADDALAEAKLRGKNRLHAWTSDTTSDVASFRLWSPVIKDALRDDRIEIHLQPIISLDTEQVAFHEALCRLRTPDRLLLPASFLPHAQRLGLMPLIDRRMLEHSRRILERHPTLTIFVNLTASSLEDETLVQAIEDILARTRRGALGLEITEHTSMHDFNSGRLVLARLRALGARVAIDDFGTGFSSFQHLASLPYDLIKIPAGLNGSNPTGEAIAQAITMVAHAHGKAVVVEGIETAEAAARARKLGIEYGQGWHYARPRPAQQLSLAARPSERLAGTLGRGDGAAG